MKKKVKINLEELPERELIYRLLSEKVGSVNPHEVFFAKQLTAGTNVGKWSCTLGGKKLTANQLGNLISEAMMLEKMQLWKVFRETLAHEANLRMFKLAKNERDLDWGKAMLHSISVFETIVKAIQDAHVDEPKRMG